MPVHSFVAATTYSVVDAAHQTADGRRAACFSFTPDPAWFQGKGSFGGVQCGGILRAMSTIADARRRPRTLHVHFCAPPIVAPTKLDVVVEREGSSMSTLSARATQDGKTVTFATATFAAPRANPSELARYRHRTMPPAPKPADVPLTPRDIPFLPVFLQNIDTRFCVGALPFEQKEQALIGAWMRFSDALDVDAPALAALADVLPPAVYARLDGPRPASSVDLTLDFYDDVVIPADRHVLAVQSSLFGDGGTTDERCELWSEDGRILCTVRQLVVLL